MKTLTEDIVQKHTLTEADINLLKRRANAGEDIELPHEEYNITDEQTRKGLDWLMNQWKTPRGVVRKNNPFGYREQEALETFQRFTFDGFADMGRMASFYVPLYTVHGKDSSFQYCLSGGQIQIVG